MNTLLNYLYRLQANAEYLAALVFIFLSFSVLAGGVFYMFTRHNFLRTRLSRFLSPQKKGQTNLKPFLLEQENTGLLAKISKPISEMHNPKEEAEVRKIKLKLIRAGLRTKRAFRYYLASKVISAFLLAGAYLLKAAFYKFSLQDLAICAVLFVIGFYLPDLIIRHITEKRQEGMKKALPDALDLMVVCVESGLGLDMTFKRVGDELQEINKDLSDEFHLTTLEIRAGKPRAQSFKNMSKRTGISEVSNLMTMLIQTSRFGTSVADALRVHADAMRIRRRQLAEEKAAKAAVKITLPLILFILPALLIVLMGPAGISLMKTVFPIMNGGG